MAIDAGTVNVPIGRVMNRVTLNVNVTGLRRFRMRMWLATRLLGIGAALLGCNIQIHEQPEVVE